MPVTTRRHRLQINDPLPPFDLDPFLSNADSLPAPAQIINLPPVPPTVPLPSPTLSSTVSSLTTLPSDISNMSANQGDASEPSTSTQSVRNPQPEQPDVLGQTAKTKPEDFRIDKFSKGDRLQANGSNFFAWKGLIEMVLIGNGWFDHVSETSVAPASTSDAHILWTQVDNLVKGQLCLNMEQSLYGELQAHFTSAKELWSILHKRFGERGGLAEEVAHTELRNKRIQTGETFDQHIVRLRELRTNYLNCGVSLRDSEWHAIIIRSLSDHPDWLHMQVYGHIIRNSEELIQVLRLQEAQIPTSGKVSPLSISTHIYSYLYTSTHYYGGSHRNL